MYKKYKNLFFWALFLCFLLEITARLYYFGLDGLTYAKLESFHGIGESGLLQVSPDPEISFELKPHLDTYFKLTKFSTNSEGFRDREHAFEKPPHTFRVAVLGASYVMGAGVPLEKAFHSVLEDRLNRESKGMTYEFINMGVGGHTQWETLAMLKNRALKYHPDLILFGATPYMYKHSRQAPVRKIRSVSHPFFSLFFVESVKISLKSFFKIPERKNKDSPTDEDIRRNIEMIFRELGDLQKDTKIPVCVVILEHRDRWLKNVPEMKRLALAHGLLIADVTLPFKGKNRTDFCSHKLDCHPNSRAHQMFADSIYAFLKEHSLTGK